MFSIIITGAKSNLDVVMMSKDVVDDEQGCWPSVVATSHHSSISVQLMNLAELSGIPLRPIIKTRLEFKCPKIL